MGSKRPLPTVEKVKLLRRLEAGEPAEALARAAGVSSRSIYNWRAAYSAFGVAGLNRKRGRKAGRAGMASSSSPDAFATPARPPDRPPDEAARAKARIAELERLVGRQQADIDFFREALRSWDEKRRVSGAPISSPSSKR